MNIKIFGACAVAMVTSLLLACGGGGGSSPTPSVSCPSQQVSNGTGDACLPENAIAITKINSFTIDYGIYGARSYYHRSGMLADLDGDGSNEYVFSISPYPQVSVPLTVIGFQNGAANLTSKYFPNGAPTVMHSPFILYSDINGDGKKDIVAADAGLDTPPWTGSKIGVAIANANNTFTNVSNLIADTTLRNYSIAIGDFNADGKTDILLSNQDQTATGSPSLLDFSNGSFQSLPFPISISDWGWPNALDRSSTLFAVDFNGDGYADLLLGGMWHGRTNTIVYGGPKGLDVTTFKELAPCPYGQDGWDYRAEGFPPKRIINSCETNSIAFDFNIDGKPDVFSTHQQWIQYGPNQITDKTVRDYDSLLKNGGSYYGYSGYTTSTNVDGKAFVNKIPTNSNLGYKYYYSLMTNDINRDGNMDVIGHYWTVNSKIDSGGQIWGTTFFINDGKGNFTVYDATDVFPELANYPYKDSGDNRPHVGSIIPVKNDANGFSGLQLLSAPNQTGKYTVQGFTTNQILKLKYIGQ